MTDSPFDQESARRPLDTGVTEPDAGGQGTKDVAKDEAKGVAQDAKQSGRQVADTAKSEAQDVTQEAKGQAQELFHQFRGEVTGQASSQQQKAAGQLQSIAGELRSMAEANQGGSAGTATGLAREAADKVESFAGWLESREPADLLDEVRDFARRKPGTFLAAAGVVGFLGGRMVRGLQKDSSGQQQGYSGQRFADEDWSYRPDRPTGQTQAYPPTGAPAYATPEPVEPVSPVLPEAPGPYGAPPTVTPGPGDALPGDRPGRHQAGGATL